MTKTQNYNLNQWEPTDPIRREDFNADNAVIDAALGAAVKVQTGTYTGTGTYGSGNYTTLTLDFPVRFLIVWGPYSHIALGIRNYHVSIHTETHWNCSAVWDGNTVKWCYADSAQKQMNQKGETYYFLAIG